MMRSTREFVRLGIIVGGLLVAMLACYTPWQTAQTKQEAIAQFTLLEESIYVPPDATLLAEVYYSERGHEYAMAGVNRIYAAPQPCEELVADYEESMTDLGWTVEYTHATGCDKEVWLGMRTVDESGFDIYAKPENKFRLFDEWQALQEQYDNLYYVSVVTYVWYEEQ